MKTRKPDPYPDSMTPDGARVVGRTGDGRPLTVDSTGTLRPVPSKAPSKR